MKIKVVLDGKVRNIEIDQTELINICITEVAKVYGYDPTKKHLKETANKYCEPRHILAVLLIEQAELSANKVSKLFDFATHATVLNSLRTFESLNLYKEFKEKYNKIKEDVEDKINKIYVNAYYQYLN